MTDNDSILRVFMQTQVFPTTDTLAAADEIYLLGKVETSLETILSIRVY